MTAAAPVTQRPVPFCTPRCPTQTSGRLADCNCGGVETEWRRLGVSDYAPHESAPLTVYADPTRPAGSHRRPR